MPLSFLSSWPYRPAGKLPWPGIEPSPLQWKHRILIIELPRQPSLGAFYPACFRRRVWQPFHTTAPQAHVSISSCFLLRLSHISLSRRQILVPVDQVCYPAGGEGSVPCMRTVGSSASRARRPVGAGSRCCPGYTWGAWWHGGQSHGGLVPGESRLSEGVLKEPSFPHQGGGCEWDPQTVPGLQSRCQGMTGQGAHRARAALSDQWGGSLAESQNFWLGAHESPWGRQSASSSSWYFSAIRDMSLVWLWFQGDGTGGGRCVCMSVSKRGDGLNSWNWLLAPEQGRLGVRAEILSQKGSKIDNWKLDLLL